MINEVSYLKNAMQTYHVVDFMRSHSKACRGWFDFHDICPEYLTFLNVACNSLVENSMDEDGIKNKITNP